MCSVCSGALCWAGQDCQTLLGVGGCPTTLVSPPFIFHRCYLNCHADQYLSKHFSSTYHIRNIGLGAGGGDPSFSRWTDLAIALRDCLKGGAVNPLPHSRYQVPWVPMFTDTQNIPAEWGEYLVALLLFVEEETRPRQMLRTDVHRPSGFGSSRK